MSKPIHKMTIRERYRFYRQWHNRFYAAAKAVDIVPLIVGAVIGGATLGVFI